MTDSTPGEMPKRTIVHLNVDGTWAPFPDHNIYRGTAWHYTDAVAALGVVRDGEVWASSSLMMNDAGELDFAIARIRTVFEAWESKGHAGAHVALRSGISSLEDDLYNNPPFIVSASKSDRLLNQWANYGTTSGFAIGFDADSLLVPKDVPEAEPEAGGYDWRLSVHGWREVIYEPSAQANHIERVLQAMVDPDGVVARSVDVGDGRSRVVTAANLALLATTLKDDAFAAEQEVRYTFQLAPRMIPEFRPTARGVVPFLRLVGSEWIEGGGLRVGVGMPIRTITVGPPIGSEKRRIASLLALRDAVKHDFSVRSAGIPYLP